jgi:pimeloyl-ACP methyl ester carboxylesterase
MERELGLDLELRHEWANLGDVRLHYVTGGQGPTIVLLHGWPQTWYMWRDVLPGLMQRYRVIAVDMRGLGDSSRPATGYDTRTVAQDIWRLMTEVLDERCFHVVAHDWGGPVAYALAALHRQAVMSMAIFDAPVPGDGSVLTAMGRWHFGFHAESDLPEALIEGREDIYLRHMFSKAGARPDAISEEARWRGRRLRPLDSGRAPRLGGGASDGIFHRSRCGPCSGSQCPPTCAGCSRLSCFQKFTRPHHSKGKRYVPRNH